VNLTPEWVVGFIDGAGLFRVQVTRQPESPGGYRVLPEFTVIQASQDRGVLYALKRFFGYGVVRPQGVDWAYRLQDLKGLAKVCEFFVQHPLKTKKNIDVRKFRRIVRALQEGRHLSSEGLRQILRWARALEAVDRSVLEEAWRQLSGG
jgi:hypothetical protein